VAVLTAAPGSEHRLVTVAINSVVSEVHELVAEKYGAGPVRVAIRWNAPLPVPG
jgi:hypothetical protein